ncbi:MAG TPA: isochorismatase family cysteine hydrolase [Gammaproteobacteria bacterium]|nr:isochorismatase family cysteine hydrolase [Gammaproteobacteria bacterium]
MTKLTRRDVFALTAVAGTAAAGLTRARAQSSPGGIVALAARPEAVAIDTARAAVLVVDMQNDFGSEGGMFQRAGIDITGIQSAVAPTARAIAAARRAGMPVAYLKMGYRPDLSDLGAEHSVNSTRHLQFGVGQTVRAPDGSESRILIRDTWNTDIVPALAPQPGDIVLYKTRFSGFYDTDLDERLKAIGVEQLIVTGCTTSVCVESTVRDAMFRDYRCVLLEDCMSEPVGAGFARSNHEASLLTVEALFGWVSQSVRFTEALAS